MSALAGWENFYVIVGSSAGALIGLQFVVLTLIAERPIRDAERAGSAFSTPTIVHFGAVLLLAAIVAAPWPQPASATIAWGLLGAFGVFYQLFVLRRVRKQTAYNPVFEDWLFHILLPFAAYATLAASALAAHSSIAAALFAVAAASLVLLFTGIHNAWDAVTWHVLVRNRPEQK